MNSGKVKLGIVAGFAAGAVLGVLFAPKRDSRAKRKIGKKTEDLVDAINDKIEAKFKEVINVVNSKLQKVKSDDSPEE